MSDNDSSLSSPLSSALSLDELSDAPGSLSDMPSSRSQSRASTPKRKKREPSPPHEYVLADNEDIAFLVMFRARFSDAFPSKLMNIGPQDIERGIVDSVPSPEVEALLCALLGLVLNRKKPVEYVTKYGLVCKGEDNHWALEEAISTQKSQWPRSWGGVNPLPGSATFNGLDPRQRLSLMRALVLWSLHTSDAISAIIKDSYKQNRQEDDKNQPLSVQSWGRDGDKRRYWLIEGKDDTDFRLYRESNPALKTITWRSVAGSIDELKLVATKLKDEDGTQAARRLGTAIDSAIPRFEATEEKRKRREYRLLRKAQFVRPEPGYSNYEGRTRGKRMKYTYSDEEDSYLSDGAPRRSTRNSNLNEPTTTLSGRQTRPRYGILNGSGGESTAGTTPAYQGEDDERATAAQNGAYNSEDFDGDSSAADDISSGEEWAGDDGKPEEPEYGSDEEMEDVVSDEEDISPQSLIITLKYGKSHRQKLPERLNPTPSQSPSRAAQPKDINGATKTEVDTSEASNPVVNGFATKPDVPITPESGEKPKSLPPLSDFLYKPNEDEKTSHTKPSPTPVLETKPNVSHFHAPDISVEAMTGQPLAFSAPTS